MVSDTHVLKELSVSHLWVFVKHCKDHHLQSTNGNLISSRTILTNFCSEFCTSLVELPVELPSCELGEIVLFEHWHALLDLYWQFLNFNRLHLLTIHIMVNLWNSTLIRPVPSSQHLTIKIYGYHLVTGRLFELLHSLLWHFDILEHNFESLSELETAFFFQLFDHFTLCIL